MTLVAIGDLFMFAAHIAMDLYHPKQNIETQCMQAQYRGMSCIKWRQEIHVPRTSLSSCAHHQA